MNNSHRELIAQTRSQNTYNYVTRRQQQQRDRPVAITPTYNKRDQATGLRQMTTGDGGVEYGRYLSNAMPSAIVLLPGATGREGAALQKPV